MNSIPIYSKYNIPALFLVAVTVVCISGAYLTGVTNGLDARLTYGVLNDLWAMTIAISDGVYGLNQGYIGYYEVQEALRHFIAPEGIYALSDHQKMLTGNREAIEAALKAAISLSSKTLSSYHEPFAPPFIVNWGEESGLADYYKLAFFFFGYHAASMYHMFFLVLTTSAGIFTWQYRNERGALAMLAALALGFWALFFLELFDHRVPSVNGNRFLATLGIIPTLHILLLINRRHLPLSRDILMGVGLQALILAFVISVRGSAVWQSLLIMLWVLMPPLWILVCRRPRWKEYQRFLQNHKRSTIALFTVFLVVICGYDAIRSAMHNRVYSGDCVLPNHFTWHSAYIGLNRHPDWMKVIPPEAGKETVDDALAWTIGAAYYHKHHPDRPYLCPKLGFYPARIHDKMMREALFDFIIAHPRYTLELYFWYKPRALWLSLYHQLSLAPRWGQIIAAGASLVGIMVGWCGNHTVREVGNKAIMLSGLLLAMLAMSTLPSLFAYPAYIFETVWLCLALGILAPACFFMLLGTMFRKGFRTAGGDLVK